MTRTLLATLTGAAAALAVAAPALGQQPLARSHALAVAAPERFVPVTPVPAATARVIADELAQAIPLPPGWTFSGVRWEEAGGAFSRAEIAGVLQYNAACQWLRAWRDGRDAATSAAVLADAPAWPAWRGAETSGVLSRIAAEVRAGGGPAAAATVRDCDASHEREQAYAAARGLPPSR